MNQFYTLILSLIMTTLSFGQVINEVDADTPGTDTAEFIEIKHTPNTALDGLVVVLYNGSNDSSYAAYDLDGKSTGANGLFILANTALATASDIDLGTSNKIQNGADAVAIYTGNASDFPNGTAATSTNLLSGVVYDTADADDTGLLAVIGGVQYNEKENASSVTQSVQRKPDGTYEVKNITFRQDNNATTCDLNLTSINTTCDAVTSGTDSYTAKVAFIGGGTSSYTVMSSAGSVDLTSGNPTSDATGTITITGISEGVDIVLSVQDGAICNLSSSISSPVCVPALPLPISENFTYIDGSLVGNSSWKTSGGTARDLLVNSGKAVVQHGTPSEDVVLPIIAVSGTIYFGFDFSVIFQMAPISGADNEYFALLKGSSFRAKVDIVPPSSTGDFSVGIATVANTANSVWATDLSFDTDYRIIVKYDQDLNIATLWIDAASEGDTSILGEDAADPGTSISSFGLRQSDSSTNEGVLIDNLKISETFAGVTLASTKFETNEFNLYPNPTKGSSVNITSNNPGAIQAIVFNVLGKRVLNALVVNDRLNVSTLNKGMYVIKLTQNETSSTKKLIIQ